MNVHVDQATATESIFTATYVAEETIGYSVELTKLTFINDVMSCPVNPENSSCSRKVLDYWAKVKAVTPTSATTCNYLIATPTLFYPDPFEPEWFEY